MRFPFRFQDPPFELDVEERAVLASWPGPIALSYADAARALADRLESPLGLPPIRDAVVPGDRVVIPVDSDLEGVGEIVGQILARLEGAGISRSDVTIVPSNPAAEQDSGEWPTGVTVEGFDPADRSAVAYLASTQDGRRIYLGRALIDADFVLPVGLIRHEPGAGPRGPWSLLFPGMSDLETRKQIQAELMAAPDDRAEIGASQEREASEVAWLLGCLYQVGIVPAAGGVAGVVVGSVAEVAQQGKALAETLWTFSTDGEADVIVAGIGRPGRPATLDDLARGLRTASALGRPGATIVLLSTVSGEPGVALRRLAGLDDPADALAALDRAEAEEDYQVALALAEALAAGKVYLYSALDEELVEDLGMVPLSRPDEAARLIARGRRCILVDQADRTRVSITSLEVSGEGRS
jgi:hypothetical protein